TGRIATHIQRGDDSGLPAHRAPAVCKPDPDHLTKVPPSSHGDVVSCDHEEAVVSNTHVSARYPSRCGPPPNSTTRPRTASYAIACHPRIVGAGAARTSVHSFRARSYIHVSPNGVSTPCGPAAPPKRTTLSACSSYAIA